MNNRYLNIAVVLGMGPTGLGVARALGRNGISIFGLDYDSTSPCLKSKYIHPILCPHPTNHAGDLEKLMYKIGERMEYKGVLYPTSDEFVWFVSSFRKQLAKHFLFAMPKHAVVKKLLNKKDTQILAERYRVPQPEAYNVCAKEDIVRVANEITYPVFLKPCLTYEWKMKGHKSKGVIANDSWQLKRQLEEFFDKKIDVIVQTIVEGPTSSLYEVCCYFDKNYQYKTGFVKRKLRQFPHDFGLGSYEESTKEDDLLAISKALLSKMNYIGPAEIEYKKDNRDGIFKLIEINVRLPMQNSLAEACCINFPLIQYADLVGQNVKFSSKYKKGIKWVWAEIDLQSFLELRSKGRLSLSEWIKSVYKADEYAIFYWRDPVPFLKSVNYGLDIFKLAYVLLKRIAGKVTNRFL